ncbi:hypothetical protein HDV01_002199 [Terramyces sp. JEL0728]|nr:hypothetical protein HDV01_002199 [Terramyces sp. JEL0728]
MFIWVVALIPILLVLLIPLVYYFKKQKSNHFNLDKLNIVLVQDPSCNRSILSRASKYDEDAIQVCDYPFLPRINSVDVESNISLDHDPINSLIDDYRQSLIDNTPFEKSIAFIIQPTPQSIRILEEFLEHFIFPINISLTANTNYNDTVKGDQIDIVNYVDKYCLGSNTTTNHRGSFPFSILDIHPQITVLSLGDIDSNLLQTSIEFGVEYRKLPVYHENTVNTLRVESDLVLLCGSNQMQYFMETLLLRMSMLYERHYDIIKLQNDQGLINIELLVGVVSAVQHPLHNGMCQKYKAPVPSDVRSPCPALNTLANHGYIAHSGKAVDLPILEQSITRVYGVGPSIAKTLVNALDKFKNPDGTFDLSALQKHNAIEHDASLVHDDTGLGPNWVTNQTLVRALTSNKTELTIQELGRFMKSRQADCQKNDHFYSYGLKSQLTGLAEASTLMTVFGNDKSARVDFLLEFLGKEKLPDGFVPKSGDQLVSVFESAMVALKLKWYAFFAQ